MPQQPTNVALFDRIRSLWSMIDPVPVDLSDRIVATLTLQPQSTKELRANPENLLVRAGKKG